MDDVLGFDIVHRGVGCTEAEDIERTDRFGPLPRPENVANDPAKAGIGAGVGFDRTGMIVRLGFKANREIFVEGDETRVVMEGGKHKPGFRVEDALRDIPNVSFEK